MTAVSHVYLRDSLGWLAVIMCFVPGTCWADSTTSEPLRIERNAATLAVSRGNEPVLVYNMQSPSVPEGIDPIYRRSGFLHPVRSPQGRTVTATFPVDHAHQHGVFSAWVKTSYDGRSVDFWNLAGGTGRVVHERVVSTFASANSSGFEVDLLHRVEGNPPIDVLRERWKVTVYTAPASYNCFDVETVQSAITNKPLTIHQYHYGGVALRGPTRWVTNADADLASKNDPLREPSSFLNDHRSDRIQGNHEHAKWVAMTGAIDGQPVTVAVLCHRDNFRAPRRRDCTRPNPTSVLHRASMGRSISMVTIHIERGTATW